MSRRRVLLLAGSAIAAATVGGLGLARRSTVPALASAFDDPEAVAEIGRWWLGELLPEQRSAASIWEFVVAAARVPSGASPRRILDEAQARAEQELAADLAVPYRGWLVAPMHLNIAALVAHELAA